MDLPLISRLKFEGNFQRHLTMVAKNREHRENLKKEHPELLAEYDSMYGCSDTEDVREDRQYPFSLWVLHYDPESGIFIARAKDLFGDSGIVGEMKGEEIKFRKIYAGRVQMPKGYEAMRGFPLIDYGGEIFRRNGSIACSGTYQPVGISENYKGIWEMKATFNGSSQSSQQEVS